MNYICFYQVIYLFINSVGQSVINSAGLVLHYIAQTVFR